MMRRAILLFVLSMVPRIVLAPRVHTLAPCDASSTISACAASMSAGSWQEMLVNGITRDMIYPGSADGGFAYASNAAWDSNLHVGYFWSAEHVNANTFPQCASPVTDAQSCANVSQRFIKYDAATNTFSLLYNGGTMNPNDGHASGEGAPHNYISHAVSTDNGDVYKLHTYLGGILDRYDHVDHTFHSMANSQTAGLSNTYVGQPIAWVPQAHGLLLYNNTAGAGTLGFYRASSNKWFRIKTGILIGDSLNLMIYNQVLHEVLLGGGGGGVGSNAYNFYVIKLTGDDPTLGRSWTVSSTRTVPVFNQCSNARRLFLDGEGASSITTVDPVSGRYLIFSRDNSCVGNLLNYNSATDTWSSPMTEGNVPPTAIYPPNGGSDTSLLEVASIPEYGVTMWLTETPANCPSQCARVFLHKSDFSGTLIQNDTLSKSAPRRP